MFTHLAALAPAKRDRDQLDQVRLPVGRSPSATKQDAFNRLRNDSVLAPHGERSQVDFALCCYAVRKGIDKEWVWAEVERVGKFAEGGRSYFETTWANAEREVRMGIWAKQRQSTNSRKPAVSGDEASSEGDCQPALDEPTVQQATKPPVRLLTIDEQTRPVHSVFDELTEHLTKSGGFYGLGNALHLIEGGNIRSVVTPRGLAGVLVGRVEVVVVTQRKDDDKRCHQPLPTHYGSAYLESDEIGRFPVVNVFSTTPIYDSNWVLAAPGYNPTSRIYYAGEQLPAAANTHLIDKLLAGFCFRSGADRANALAALLDGPFRHHFEGGRPIATITANQRSLGKSLLAQVIATVRGVGPAKTITYTPNDEELEKRLAAQVLGAPATIVVDNAKAEGRHGIISSAVIERSITDPALSFRRLGANAEISLPNSVLFVLTANTPRLSPDLVSRSLPINLYHEGNPDNRNFAVEQLLDFAKQHRAAIQAELIGMIERWKTAGRPLPRFNYRFAPWASTVGGILQANGVEGFLENLTESAADLDPHYTELRELVEHAAGRRDQPAGALATLCIQHALLTDALGTASPHSRAVHLANLLGRYVGETFTVPSQCGRGTAEVSLEVREDRHSKRRVYSFIIHRERFLV